jgi:chromosome segregation ATPase
MSRIGYEKIEGEIRVTVPYLLKDDFKSKFRNAKWESASKKWIISSRSEKRLISYIEAVAANEQAIEELEQAELTLAEIQETVNELKRIKAEAAKIQEEIINLQEKHGELKDVKQQLDKEFKFVERLKNERESAKEAVEKEKTFIEEQLKKFFDLNEVKAAAEKVRKIHNTVGNKEGFIAAKQPIRAAIEALEAEGLRLLALNYIDEANYNRPDRDGLENMPADFWYKLEKIEEE